MHDIYYWSPSVQFKVEDENLYIGKFNYGKKGAKFFPKFYYITQDGITLENLKNSFPKENQSFINNLINDFIKRKFLVSTIISPKELFHSQKKLFHNEYSEDIKFIKEKLEQFKEKQTMRQIVTEGTTFILENVPFDDDITSRVSIRNFSMEQISFKSFSKILGVLQNKLENNRRYYPSAGSLFPIDVYVYIKKDRIEGVEKGLYYYNPMINGIVFVDNGEKFTDEAQYITNREIFSSSAFTTYFVYNAECSMPKYGGMAYYYGIIECGILVQLMTNIAEKENIGSCSIGDMIYEKIIPYFHLNSNQIVLHSLEFGHK